MKRHELSDVESLEVIEAEEVGEVVGPSNHPPVAISHDQWVCLVPPTLGAVGLPRPIPLHLLEGAPPLRHIESVVRRGGPVEENPKQTLL